MAKLYIFWFGSSLITLCLAWYFSRKRALKFRVILLTGIFALGFTVVPVGKDGEGMLLPMGLYYFARNDWLEAATAATLVIGIFWSILLSLCYMIIVITRFIKKIRKF